MDFASHMRIYTFGIYKLDFIFKIIKAMHKHLRSKSK